MEAHEKELAAKRCEDDESNRTGSFLGWWVDNIIIISIIIVSIIIGGSSSSSSSSCEDERGDLEKRQREH